MDRGDVAWGDGVMELTRDGEGLLPRVEVLPAERTDRHEDLGMESIEDAVDIMFGPQPGILETYGVRCDRCGRLKTRVSHCDAGVPSAETAPSPVRSQESVRP